MCWRRDGHCPPWDLDESGVKPGDGSDSGDRRDRGDERASGSDETGRSDNDKSYKLS